MTPNETISKDNGNPHIWLVTTAYNSVGRLSRYFECLIDQDYEPISLILVDHGTDSISGRLPLPDNSTLLRGHPSHWWTHAVNIGIEYVLSQGGVDDSDIILLQNDDSTFGPSFVSELVNAVGGARRAVGSVVIDRNTRKVLHANLKFDSIKAKYLYLHYGDRVAVLGDSLMASDALKGRGVAYPVKVVKEIGLLNTRLPHYRSDHEWAHRAKKLGVDVVVCPQAICETVIDTQAQISVSRPFATYWQVLFSRRSPANLQDMARYFYICFGPAKASYCVVVNGLRTLLVSTSQLFRALVIKAIGGGGAGKTS